MLSRSLPCTLLLQILIKGKCQQEGDYLPATCNLTAQIEHHSYDSARNRRTQCNQVVQEHRHLGVISYHALLEKPMHLPPRTHIVDQLLGLLLPPAIHTTRQVPFITFFCQANLYHCYTMRAHHPSNPPLKLPSTHNPSQHTAQSLSNTPFSKKEKMGVKRKAKPHNPRPPFSSSLNINTNANNEEEEEDTFQSMPLTSFNIHSPPRKWGFSKHQRVTAAILKVQKEGLVRGGKMWDVGELRVFEVLGVSEMLRRQEGEAKRGIGGTKYRTKWRKGKREEKTADKRPTDYSITDSKRSTSNANNPTFIAQAAKNKHSGKSGNDEKDINRRRVHEPDPLRNSHLPSFNDERKRTDAIIHENQRFMRTAMNSDAVKRGRGMRENGVHSKHSKTEGGYKDGAVIQKSGSSSVAGRKGHSCPHPSSGEGRLKSGHGDVLHPLGMRELVGRTQRSTPHRNSTAFNLDPNSRSIQYKPSHHQPRALPQSPQPPYTAHHIPSTPRPIHINPAKPQNTTASYLPTRPSTSTGHHQTTPPYNSIHRRQSQPPHYRTQKNTQPIISMPKPQFHPSSRNAAAPYKRWQKPPSPVQQHHHTKVHTTNTGFKVPPFPPPLSSSPALLSQLKKQRHRFSIIPSHREIAAKKGGIDSPDPHQTPQSFPPAQKSLYPKAAVHTIGTSLPVPPPPPPPPAFHTLPRQENQRQNRSKITPSTLKNKQSKHTNPRSETATKKKQQQRSTPTNTYTPHRTYSKRQKRHWLHQGKKSTTGSSKDIHATSNDEILPPPPPPPPPPPIALILSMGAAQGKKERRDGKRSIMRRPSNIPHETKQKKNKNKNKNTKKDKKKKEDYAPPPPPPPIPPPTPSNPHLKNQRNRMSLLARRAVPSTLIPNAISISQEEDGVLLTPPLPPITENTLLPAAGNTDTSDADALERPGGFGTAAAVKPGRVKRVVSMVAELRAFWGEREGKGG
ncbi:unnamed protein product [Periconia digitata]|uniref:Uncharacterized protein n=1 Tax=Periconia digitata TaxID=1303443 RepID=A0A9W4U8Y7_9PLEO|nr:unnamed protein product [Periconia digitata]